MLKRRRVVSGFAVAVLAVVGTVAPVAPEVTASIAMMTPPHLSDEEPSVPEPFAGPLPAVSWGGGGVEPLVPRRVLDTRDGTGVPAGRVGPGQVRSLQVTGTGGVPLAGVGAVVLNVTAVSPTRASFVTVWPNGANRPSTSNLNLRPGVTVPNLVVVKVGAAGRVNFYNEAGEVNLLADVMGWFPVAGGVEPVVPARLLDTRSGVGAPSGRVGPGQQRSLQVTGRGGVPTSGVGAVVLNVTAVSPTKASFVTAWPNGSSRPVTSNLNLRPGVTVPNLVVVKVGTGGRVNLYNDQGDVHLLADVMGWFPDVGGVQPLAPQRLLDTRSGIGAPSGRVGPGQQRALQVTGRGGVPASGVGAVVLNVTAVSPTKASFVTAWPNGSSRPVTSNLNLQPGVTVPNLVVVKVGTGGRVNLYNEAGDVHLLADVMGWFPVGGDTAVTVQPKPGTLLVGGSDVIEVTSNVVTLAASATRPTLGGHLVIFPNRVLPDGRLGKVASVMAMPNGTLRVTLLDAIAEDALEDLAIEYEGPLGGPAVLSGPAPAGYSQSPIDCSGDGEFARPSVVVDPPTASFSFRMRTLSMRFDLSTQVGIGFNWQLEGSLTCSFTIPLGKWVLGPTGVLVEPSLVLSATLGGEMSAGLNYKVPVKVGFTAVGPLVIPRSSFGTPTKGMELDTTAEIFASVGAAIAADVKFLGKVGLSLSIGAEVTGTVSFVDKPCLTFDLGFVIGVEVHVDVLVKEWEFELADIGLGPIELYATDLPICKQGFWVGTITIEESLAGTVVVQNPCENYLQICTSTWAVDATMTISSTDTPILTTFAAPPPPSGLSVIPSGTWSGSSTQLGPCPSATWSLISGPDLVSYGGQLRDGLGANVSSVVPVGGETRFLDVYVGYNVFFSVTHSGEPGCSDFDYVGAGGAASTPSWFDGCFPGTSDVGGCAIPVQVELDGEGNYVIQGTFETTGPTDLDYAGNPALFVTYTFTYDLMWYEEG